jgi:hypothetical protein
VHISEPWPGPFSVILSTDLRPPPESHELDHRWSHFEVTTSNCQIVKTNLNPTEHFTTTTKTAPHSRSSARSSSLSRTNTTLLSNKLPLPKVVPHSRCSAWREHSCAAARYPAAWAAQRVERTFVWRPSTTQCWTIPPPPRPPRTSPYQCSRKTCPHRWLLGGLLSWWPGWAVIVLVAESAPK